MSDKRILFTFKLSHLRKYLNESKSTTLDDSDSEDIPIIDDNKYDLETKKKAEILFRKLFQTAVGSYKITQFFSSTNNINLNDNEEIENQLDYESKNDSMEESAHTPKMKASQTVAKIHNGGEYHASCIYTWVRTYLEENELPSSQHRKHLLKLFLHDEYVSLRDGVNQFWASEKRQLLRKKGLGLGLHVSEFLTEEIERLKDKKKEAQVIMQLGSKYDKYWNREKLLLK
ncbi:8513_t:CDS:2, partial [Cetraspora pellucida]